MAYPISKLWIYPICRVLLKRIGGIENIPNKITFVIISNHEKLVDPLLIIYPILRRLNKKVHFIATPTWWFLGETICRKWAGCIPLFDSKQAYKEAKEIIKSGGIIGIFPEGGTRRTKNPRTGAVRLSIQTNTAILPVSIKSSYLPFNSTINIGNLMQLNKKNNLKKQSLDLMKYIYKLRSGKI